MLLLRHHLFSEGRQPAGDLDAPDAATAGGLDLRLRSTAGDVQPRRQIKKVAGGRLKFPQRLERLVLRREGPLPFRDQLQQPQLAGSNFDVMFVSHLCRTPVIVNVNDGAAIPKSSRTRNGQD